MKLAQLISILRAPNKRPLLSLMVLMKGNVKFLTLGALNDAGVLQSLSTPKTLEEIAESLDVRRVDLLSHLLQLGVCVGLLKQKNGRFKAKTSLSRFLGATDGAALSAFLSEQVNYHSQVFRDLPSRLLEGEPTDYLASYAPLIAESSRIVEPFLRPYARRLVEGLESPRILEIGCGEGEYLSWYAADCAGSHGIAIDLDARVVERAKARLARHGLTDFEIQQADVLSPPESVRGPFHLVTSIQNIYYFSESERAKLFAWVREQLAAGGTYCLVTPTFKERMMSHYFALLLGSTTGCWPIPTLDKLKSELTEAGFSEIRCERLVPLDEFWGIEAKV